MTYINKIKDTEVELARIDHGGFGGEFKMVAFKGVEFPKGSGNVFEFAGTRRVLQDWNSNIITNDGLDNYGKESHQSISQFGWCHVGTGNTPPTATDSQLEAFVAAATVTGNFTASARSTPPYYGYAEVRYLFQPGFGGGNVNLNEIAAATGSDQTSITARSLTVDGNGDPTTITVLSDEYLECYYRRRNYPAHIVEATGVPTDDQDTVVIDGVSYTYTIRPANVDYGGTIYVGTGTGWGSGCTYGNTQPVTGFQLGDIYHTGTAGGSSCVLSTVTSAQGANPFQTSPGQATDQGASTYTTDTYSKEMWWQWGISNAIDAGGIGGLNLKTKLGAYQLVFNNPVPKVYGEVFTFYHNFSWARKTTWV